MFDEKFRSEYKNITAPDELYNKILNAETPEVKNNIKVYVRTALTLAAAFAAVFITAFTISDRGSIPNVYLDGEKLTGEVSITQDDNGGIMLARSMNELSLMITLELESETALTLSEGLIFSDSGEMLLASENSKTFNGSVSFNWIIPGADTEKVYSMELKDKNGTYFITLSFDSRAQIWNACLTK